MKAYLVSFLFAYLLITFVLPTLRVWRQTGINPFVVPNDDSAHGFIGKVFRLITALALAAGLINAFAEGWNKYLLPVWYLENEAVRWAGWILLHLSLALIVAAQAQMKKSWRIGIDEKHRTELVTTGFFKYSRNPIFLGMLLTMLGLFLVLPNALTLMAVCFAWIALQVQARLEEVFLRQVHGEKYVTYGGRVRRWI